MKNNPPSFEAAGYTFEVVDPVLGMRYSFVSSSPEPGVTELALTLSADTPVVPTRSSLVWTVPVVDLHYKWNPDAFRHRYLDVMNDCANSFHSGAHGAAPVMSLYNMAGTNALTFALSATLPFFCTWYSHHGDVTQDDVLLQARLARELGVETIIIDGGWGVPLPELLPEQLLIANATFRDRVVLELPVAAGKRLLTVTSATGETGEPCEFDLTAGLHRLAVPAGGYALLASCAV